MNYLKLNPASRNHGFSLIEIIGVMAVVAILAGALAPSLFDAIEDANSTAEEQNLATLAGSLQRYIRQHKRIPSPSALDWGPNLALFSNLPAKKVTENRYQYQRSLYFDPRFFTSTDTAFSGFTQVQGLPAAPVSPRIMLVSDLSGDAPSAPTSTAAFDAIWNQSSGAVVTEGPKVKVQRINLASLFHRVILTNSQPRLSPAYSLEIGAQVPIPAATGTHNGILTRYVLDSSQLNLYPSPYPSGTMANRALVTNSIDFLYQSNGSNWYWARP